MIRDMGKSGKILENYEADLENIAFHYSLCLLTCYQYIALTFCGQNFNIIWISAKTISTHLYNEILS